MKHDASETAVQAVRDAIAEVEGLLAAIDQHRQVGEATFAECNAFEAELKRRPLSIRSKEEAIAAAAKYASDLAALSLWKPSAMRAGAEAGLGREYDQLPSAAMRLLELADGVAEGRCELQQETFGELYNRCVRDDRVAAAESACRVARLVLSRRFPAIPYNQQWGYGPLRGEALSYVLNHAVPVAPPA